MPQAIFVRGCHGNAQIHVYQISPACIVWRASLTSEEVVIGKSSRGNLNTHVYQVSAPCIAWFASLRSEEVVIGKSACGHFVDGCHGNNEIHMCTKFHLHVHYSWQV